MSELITIRDRMVGHRDPGMLAWVAGALASRGQRPPVADEYADEAPPIEARVEHGRWLIDCPLCPSANLGDPHDARFFCIDCGNRRARGLWFRVAYPADWPEIERLLLVRPADNRNWRPGETVADLERENAEHAEELTVTTSVIDQGGPA